MAGKKMVSRKTQVALFFIFGLVIIIAVSFLNYIASESAKSGIKASREIVNVAEMPASLLPVKLNIDLCMKEIAEQAVIAYKIGPSRAKRIFDNGRSIPQSAKLYLAKWQQFKKTFGNKP